MAETRVRGVNIHYRVLGEDGPWVAISPGGRRGMDAQRRASLVDG